MNSTKLKREHLRLLLTPSLLSASLGVLFSLALIISATIISLGKAGRLQDDLFAVNYVRHGLNGSYNSITQSLNNNRFISQLPLWLFWAGVGVIAYLFAISLFRAVIDMLAVRKSLKYVHANPHKIMVEVFQHLIIRLVCLAIGWEFIHLCFKNILPYCLSLIRAASKHWTLPGSLKLVGVAVLLILVSHVLTIILRLLMLKPRIFS